MNFSDILLIIISSAGLLHGIVLAVYLVASKKKKSLSNRLLALILVCMAFRVGKSVMLNFGHDLESIYIFAGLAFLLLIGPFLRWYVISMTQDKAKLQGYHFWELMPFCLLFLSGFFISGKWRDIHNNNVIIIFASVLIFTYLHLAFYIFTAGSALQKANKTHTRETRTKSQKAILHWLRMLLIGFCIIWISYVLNIVENTVPYITGPMMYSIVVYVLSFKGFQLKITDLDGTVFKKNDDLDLFQRISSLVIDNKMYREPSVSLSDISQQTGKSPQKTSEVINQYANQNFNDFINFYRIQEAKKFLLQKDKENYTISSIAFDAGFNSLSSFNSAFKKHEGTTPSQYRKQRK